MIVATFYAWPKGGLYVRHQQPGTAHVAPPPVKLYPPGAKVCAHG